MDRFNTIIERSLSFSFIFTLITLVLIFLLDWFNMTLHIPFEYDVCHNDCRDTWLYLKGVWERFHNKYLPRASHGKDAQLPCQHQELQSLREVLQEFRDFGQAQETSSWKFIQEVSLCGKTLQNQADLIDHIQRHHSDKKFPCQECGKTFSTNKDLLKHIRRNHTRREKSEQCGQCELKFYDVHGLRNHVISVHDKILWGLSALWSLKPDTNVKKIIFQKITVQIKITHLSSNAQFVICRDIKTYIQIVIIKSATNVIKIVYQTLT